MFIESALFVDPKRIELSTKTLQGFLASLGTCKPIKNRFPIDSNYLLVFRSFILYVSTFSYHCRCSTPLEESIGAPYRTRTDNIRITSAALYQLKLTEQIKMQQDQPILTFCQYLFELPTKEVAMTDI